MLEEIPGPSAQIPPVEPMVGGGVPSVDRPAEIPSELLDKVRTVTVTRFDIRRIAATDKCTLRLQRELTEAKAQTLPAKLEIEAAKKRLKMAHQHLCKVQSAREQKAATVSMLEAQLYQRLTTIAEREEGRRVRAIRARIAPQFRDEISSER